MTSSPPPFSGRSWPRTLGWLGPWVAVAALWHWAGAAGPWALPLAAAGVTATALFRPPDRRRAWSVGSVLLFVGILVGFAAERQVGSILGSWDAYWADRVDEIGDLLSDELDRRQLQGEAAADALVARWVESGGTLGGAGVREIRTRYGSQALALYDAEGVLMAWDGEHRGKVPESVQAGTRRQAYRDLPLFGYLYLTSTGPDGEVAVAAYLLRAALPEGLGADMGDLATNFFGETGERIRVTEDDPGIAEAVWDLELGDDRLLSVVLERPEREDRARTTQRRWARTVSVVTAVAWLLLALGGPRGRSEAAVAALTLTAAAAWVPLGPIGAGSGLLDPTAFLLPGPVDLTVGRLALVCVVAFALVAVAPRAPVEGPAWLVGGLVGGAFVLVTLWLRAAASSDLLAMGRPEWIAYQIGCAGTLSLVAGVGLSHVRRSEGSRVLAVSGVVGAVALASAGAVWIRYTAAVELPWTVLWALPVAATGYGVHAWTGWQRSLIRWGCAVLLGSTAAIPVAWGQGIEARLGEGTRTLQRLAALEDPEMEDRLFDFARIADSLDVDGAEDVTILYDGWRLSGLADLGHPVWLQLEERDGSPGEGLRVGVGEGEPQPYQDLLAQGRRAGTTRLVQLNQDDARYILTTPLTEGRMLVAVAPPLPESSRGDGLGPLLRSAGDTDLEALTVLRLPDVREPPPYEIVVAPTTRGWRAEIGLEFANGPAYQTQYSVDLPGLPLAVARATLLVVLNLLLFLTFWVGGRALLGDAGREGARFGRWGISFRARVTMALFGFFALANALFGTVAYQTLSQASNRSAQVLADRVLEDAAGWYQALDGQMERLASQVGAELLEYRDGELWEGSVEELVELGLYEGWTPYAVQRDLEAYEIVEGSSRTAVGRWAYVTTYRRLPDGDVLAAQVPLQAGTSALQTTDLVELLGFVILLGGALSLALAMIAGRALTRPIHALQLASERVGSGDLGLRLPAHRADEFGAVFRAFNRMVGRVRRARRQLVRTSRRTQLIMDEAAVGMVALDPAGRVTLVNPRAEELLGAAMPVGAALPSDGTIDPELRSWFDDYLEGSADEANSDFQVGERRIRVRVRRLGTFGTRRGVVVALDDVTDELRAERVLAWGEMARQVAHEVKNPLTPIKLSIQHVRRAWDDQHPDFDRILVKNADAMLAEIDRLAEIAQSFSRFGAPGGDQVVPLAPVVIADVVDEVMALYGGSAARVHFEQDVAPDLPPVVARNAELKEVLVNLLENARLAGQDGTRVTIVAHRAEGDGVVLSVVDDGAGIPEDVLPRIFEPQFSTRSKGTGLGLAIVQRVVRAWGGSVSVTSELGVGTEVTVTLRAWTDESDAAGGSGPHDR